MTFHVFHINEVYSNANGTVQFIEFAGDADDQDEWAGHTITSSNGTTPILSISPPIYPAKRPTANRYWLQRKDLQTWVSLRLTTSFRMDSCLLPIAP